MGNSLESIALTEAQKHFPSNQFQRKGFRKALRADPDWDEYAESGWVPPRLVPDAWFKETFQRHDEDPDVLWMWPDAETARDLGGLDDWPYRHDTNGNRILHPPYDHFTAIEIENAHKMSINKLKAYADLWDCYGCAFSLFVFDRYGMNKREINLSSYFAI